MVTDPSVVYASWRRRVVAWLLDAVVVFVPIWGVATAAAVALEDAATGIASFLILVLASPLYYAWFHSRERGQTPAKRALGIAVRDARTFGRLPFGRALLRSCVHWLFFVLQIPWILDVSWPLVDARRQSWHDKIAVSVVVRT